MSHLDPGPSADARSYDARRFWSERLERFWSLRGTGYVGYSERYNGYLYRAKVRGLRRALVAAGVEVAGRSVLDLGSGTGFWLRWYAEAGARVVAGLELSAPAVARLRLAFPGMRVWEGDVGTRWPFDDAFDLVNAFDVLYHVTDDAAFRTALAEAVEHLVPGGWLVLSDRIGGADTRIAPHVRFRGVDTYRRLLSGLGVSIEGVFPLYHLMNGGIANARPILGREKLAALAVAVENVAAPLLFALDGWLLGRVRANLSVLVARKAAP